LNWPLSIWQKTPAGFVFVRSQLEKRRRRAATASGGAKGFGAAPKPSAKGKLLAALALA
jgi:hypothetical protein